MTDNLYPTQSVMLYENQPTRTYGGGARGVDYIRLGISPIPAKFWGLYAFPPIPVGAYLQSAILTLYAPASVFDAPDGDRIYPSTAAFQLHAHAITKPWQEATANWKNKPTIDTVQYPILTVPTGSFPKILQFDVTAVLNAQKDTGYGFAIVPPPDAWRSNHIGFNRSNTGQPLPYLAITYIPVAPPTGIYVSIGGVVRTAEAYVKPTGGGAVQKAQSFTYKVPGGEKYTV